MSNDDKKLDMNVLAYAVGSFEITVRLKDAFGGDETVGNFLRIGRRDLKRKVEELFASADLCELAKRKGIHMKPIRFSPNVTVTFEERGEP
jgi:hypothetical protein